MGHIARQAAPAQGVATRTDPALARPLVRAAALLALTAFLTYASFIQDPRTGNVISRIALTESITRHHQLTIDRYAKFTIDRAYRDGHFYSDKAPGLSFMAVPAAALLWTSSDRQRYAHDSAAETSPSGLSYDRLVYAAGLSTSSLLVALAVGALFLVTLNLWGSPWGAAFAAGAYGLASPTFGWATVFIGHAPAGALSFLGFACFQTLERNPSSRRALATIAIGTAFLTWAVMTEFTAAPVALIIAVHQARRVHLFSERWRVPVACALITTLVCASPLFLYDWLAFGAPWHLGYESVQGFPGMRQGLLGIGLPSLHVLYEITFGVQRGILLLCPLLLLVPVAIAQMNRRSADRGLALTVTLIVAYYLTLNASYFYWNGGYSTGPRHIVAMLPFACLPLGFLWLSPQRHWRTAALALGSVSLVLALMCASSNVFDSYVPNEITDYVLPRFITGRTTAMPVRFFDWRFRQFLPAFLAYWAVASVVIRRHLTSWAVDRTRDDQWAPETPETAGVPV